MEEFKTYLMEDLIEEIAMGPFGSNIKVDCFVDSGVPVLNGANLQGFKLREDSFNYVTTEKADSLNKANAYRGDIVITHRGTLGQIVYIPQDSKYKRYVISQSQFRVRVNPKVALPEYVVFYFHTRIGQHRLLANASQVGVPAIARPSTTFKKVEIELPCLKEQKRIIEIINSLSDKIELNNRINHNLEEQADCLLSSAIETQANGSAHLWDICSYVSGKVNCDTLINENYISTDNMFANRGGVGIASTIPGGKCTSFMARDILVSNIRPYFKKVWRASFSGGCSNDVLCFRSTTGTSSFLYHLLRSDAFFDYVMSGAKGSKMPRGDKQHIMNWEIPLFENGFIASLEDSLKVIDDRVAIIQEENRRLSAMRDSLLPMLMNNRVSINDLTC